MATLRSLERIQAQLVYFSWANIWLLLVAHAGIAWGLMTLAGESRIIAADVFFYFWITTGTTVGYGDYSPTTLYGRLVTAVWIMPGAILWISAVLAKIANATFTTWRNTMQRSTAGLSDHKDLQNHIVVLGYVADRTPRILKLLAGDGAKAQTVLLVGTQLNHPEPQSGVLFVRATSLTDEEALARAAINNASVVVALGENDSETLSASLAAAAINESVHLVSYFQQPSSARVLRLHCPQAEIINSIYVESIARAAKDPGSSALIGELLDPERGQTQYSMVLAKGSRTSFGDLFVRMKSVHEALLIGVRSPNGSMTLNPPWARTLSAGDVVYYMAAQRIALTLEDCVV